MLWWKVAQLLKIEAGNGGVGGGLVFRRRWHRLLESTNRRGAAPLQVMRLSAARPRLRRRTLHCLLSAPRFLCLLWLCSLLVLVQGPLLHSTLSNLCFFFVFFSVASIYLIKRLTWGYVQPQVEVKSFPAEQIKPLAANSEGTYIVGGGSSGDVFLWEVNLLRLCFFNNLKL